MQAVHQAFAAIASKICHVIQGLTKAMICQVILMNIAQQPLQVAVHWFLCDMYTTCAHAKVHLVCM
jgi:hypothetical protein